MLLRRRRWCRLIPPPQGQQDAFLCHLDHADARPLLRWRGESERVLTGRRQCDAASDVRSVDEIRLLPFR